MIPGQTDTVTAATNPSAMPESAEAFLHDFRQHNYNADAADRMNRLFAEITAAPAAIETSRNKALIDEIKPWLMQFHLLGKAGQKAIRTAETGQGEDRAATWQSYLSLTSLLDSMRTIDQTYNQNPYQKGVKVGSRVLTPFVQEIHSGVGSNLLFADQTDAATQMSKASILTDIEQLKYQPLKEGKDQIGYNRLNEVLRIEPGQSFGLTWELQKEATSFNFSLPKAKTADVYSNGPPTADNGRLSPTSPPTRPASNWKSSLPEHAISVCVMQLTSRCKSTCTNLP